MKNKTMIFSQELIGWIEQYVRDNKGISRYRLSKVVCEKMDWRSSTGKFRELDCRKEMIRLNREAKLTLPEPMTRSNFYRKGDYSHIKLSFPTVSCSLSEFGEIRLVQVTKGDLAYIWNYMMKNIHYMKSSMLCGQQIRYLVHHESYGWIGGLSFNSSALSIECRDKYIGWSLEDKQNNLTHVLCNSRFLIVPGIKVKYLASHILSKAVRQLPGDWKNRYGVEPVLLETFIDKTLFEGTCYQAANWLYIGETKGRGRNDRNNKKGKTIKKIYVYPLRKDWRRHICTDIPTPICEQPPRRVSGDWVDEELESLDLGDYRLVHRLKKMTRDSFAKPCASIPKRSNGKWGDIKGFYGFLKNDKVNKEKILSPHMRATCERMKDQSIVLAVQDTTELDLSHLVSNENLGSINDNQKGFLVHDTMAFTPEGTPLGIIDVQVWKRDPETLGNKKNLDKIPIEEKESYKWIKSFHRCDDLKKQCPGTTIVNIGDRESDIYELFWEKQRTDSQVELLIRSNKGKSRRCSEGYIWNVLPNEPELARIDVEIPHSGNRKGRVAKVSVSMKRSELIAPKSKSHLPNIAVTCIYLKEIEYDSSLVENPLEWMLLTTLEVPDNELMFKIVSWYTKRWCIEIYHKVLKSGCKVETRQLDSDKSITNCLAIDMFIGWRIYYLVKMGREVPQLPCTVCFEEDEWKALTFYYSKKNSSRVSSNIKRNDLDDRKTGWSHWSKK
jgi:hypothetical protein